MALSQAKSWSEDSLKDLSRRELQKVAKNLGVRGNMKSTDIISEILATISGSTQGDTAGCGDFVSPGLTDTGNTFGNESAYSKLSFLSMSENLFEPNVVGAGGEPLDSAINPMQSITNAEGCRGNARCQLGELESDAETPAQITKRDLDPADPMESSGGQADRSRSDSRLAAKFKQLMSVMKQSESVSSPLRGAPEGTPKKSSLRNSILSKTALWASPQARAKARTDEWLEIVTKSPSRAPDSVHPGADALGPPAGDRGPAAECPRTQGRKPGKKVAAPASSKGQQPKGEWLCGIGKLNTFVTGKHAPAASVRPRRSISGPLADEPCTVRKSISRRATDGFLPGEGAGGENDAEAVRGVKGTPALHRSMSLTCSRMEELGEELSRMQEDFRRSFGPELMRRSVSCASSAAPGCSAGEASGPQAEPRRERPPVAQTRPRYTPARRTSSASEKKAVLSAFPPATHATVLKRQGTRRGVPQSPAAPQRAVAGETAAERRGGRTPAAKAGPGGRQGLEAPSAAITPAKPVSASKAPRRQASAPKEAPRMYDFSPAPAGRQPGAQRANVAATPRSAVPTHRRPSKPPQATRTPLWGKAPVRKPAPSNTPAPRPHSVSSRGCVTAKGTPSAAARKLEEDCNVQSSCTGTLARGRALQGGRWGPGCSSYKERIALGSAPLQSGRPSPRTPVFDPDIMAEARELAELMHPSKSEPLQADLPPTLEPSLWELALKQPGVTWDDVPEMASARSEVEAHLLESGAGARCSKSRPCALLLLHEGAGGLAEAAAHGLGAQLMHISPVLMSSSELQGQERELQDSVFTRAFQSPLSVILIDYLDRQPKGKVARELRNALMSDLCLYLEACAEQPNRQTAVLVATSRPETLSSDLLTNLRTKIFIPLPPEHVREDIIFSRLARRSDNAALSVEDIGRLASMTDGWSASDIKEACDRVLSGAGCGRTVSFEDFKAQLMSATPRISSGKAARLESWARSNAGPGPKGEACP